MALKRKRRNAAGSVHEEGRKIDYLGYCFSRENTRIRKSIKQKFARKVKNCKDEKKLLQVKASYWGWCKWGDGMHLWKKITKNDMGFASKGIHPTGQTKDGKKYYDVRRYQLMDILNIPITIVEFEAGVDIPGKGSDRYVVLFKDAQGQLGKFVTTAFNIKNILDQAKAAEANGQKIFPVENVIVRKKSLGDGKSSYYFDE